jgi:hypothetical protein
MPLVQENGVRVDDDVPAAFDVTQANNNSTRIAGTEEGFLTVKAIIGFSEVTYEHPTCSEGNLYTVELHHVRDEVVTRPVLKNTLTSKHKYLVYNVKAPPLGFSPVLIYTLRIRDSDERAAEYAKSSNYAPARVPSLAGWPRIINGVEDVVWTDASIFPEGSKKDQQHFVSTTQLYIELCKLLPVCQSQGDFDINAARRLKDLRPLKRSIVCDHTVWFSDTMWRALHRFRTTTFSGSLVRRYCADMRYPCVGKRKNLSSGRTIEGYDNYYHFATPEQCADWAFRHPEDPKFPYSEYVTNEQVAAWVSGKIELDMNGQRALQVAAALWRQLWLGPTGTTMIHVWSCRLPPALCCNHELVLKAACVYLSKHAGAEEVWIDPLAQAAGAVPDFIALASAIEQRNVLSSALEGKDVRCVHSPAFFRSEISTTAAIHNAHKLTTTQLVTILQDISATEVVLVGDAVLAVLPRSADVVTERKQEERPFAHICSTVARRGGYSVEFAAWEDNKPTAPIVSTTREVQCDAWFAGSFVDSLALARERTDAVTEDACGIRLRVNDWYFWPARQIAGFLVGTSRPVPDESLADLTLEKFGLKVQDVCQAKAQQKYASGRFIVAGHGATAKESRHLWASPPLQELEPVRDDALGTCWLPGDGFSIEPRTFRTVGIKASDNWTQRKLAYVCSLARERVYVLGSTWEQLWEDSPCGESSEPPAAPLSPMSLV